MIAFGLPYEAHRERQWRAIPMAHVMEFVLRSRV
jgi:hypothetical protein